jgi:D-beta-D-heptose 7-phosphate kinase/D-beta-D-heptose 1-phosphate adenosyltransferase
MILPQMEHFLRRLAELKILVIGDLMLDEYLWGKTERISPEAPVQIVEVEKEELRLGGAGNVVNNLAALGCKVHVAGIVGDHHDGRTLYGFLQDLNVNCDALYQVEGRIVSRKTRVIASHQQMLRIDRESRHNINPEHEQLLIDHISELSSPFDAVIISDYLKGVLTPKVLSAVISYGRIKGIPIVVDPKGGDFSRYSGATVLTPNRREAQLASGIHIVDEQSLCDAGKKLLMDLDLELLVLTRSQEGMTLFYRDGRNVHLPTQAQEVFDVSGAGDTVVAILAAGLASGLSFDDSARVANLGAGVVVSKLGTSTISPAELDSAARHVDHGDARKILSRDELATIISLKREEEKKIVFTNGCFDLLHVGHVKYLQKAKTFGDVLVLGLNSDASIKRLKGEKRPLICEEERAHILAALDCVDYVTIFDEDTPVDLIAAMWPDVLVKGADYSLDGVVGRELVESRGGKVELVEFVGGKSTTGIVEKVLQNYR